MIKKILLVFCALVSPTAAFASSVSYVNSPSFNMTALSNFSALGDMMDGMSVTARYSDGTSEFASWADTTSGNGAAVGSSFSLSESGDTFGGLWTLSTTTSVFLSSIKIDAGTGNTVFDVSNGGAGSPGSANGWTFSIDSATVDVDVIYSSNVSVAGTSYFDLYRYLQIDFLSATSAPGGFGANDSLTFVADTDNLFGDLTPVLEPSMSLSGDLTPVPEPSTFVLLCGGLAGLALVTRRRKKR